MSLKKIRILPDQYVFKQNEKGDTAFLVISGGLIAELDSKKLVRLNLVKYLVNFLLYLEKTDHVV